MKENEKNNDLDNISIPEAKMPEFQKQLRLTILNTKKSALWGAVLMFLPVYFALAMIFKYNLGIGFLSPPIDYLLNFAIFETLSPVIFIGGLMLAILFNLFAVLHLSFGQDTSEFIINISIKKKRFNLIILGIAGLFFFIFMLYGFLENWIIRN